MRFRESTRFYAIFDREPGISSLVHKALTASDRDSVLFLPLWLRPAFTLKQKLRCAIDGAYLPSQGANNIQQGVRRRHLVTKVAGALMRAPSHVANKTNCQTNHLQRKEQGDEGRRTKERKRGQNTRLPDCQFSPFTLLIIRLRFSFRFSP